jgi:hypothetical protein
MVRCSPDASLGLAIGPETGLLGEAWSGLRPRGMGMSPGAVARSDVDAVPGHSGQGGGPGPDPVSPGRLAGNPAPSQVPAGVVASREVPGSAQPSQGQAPPGSPRRALTRLALAGSGDTGRPGRARSARQPTANPAVPLFGSDGRDLDLTVDKPRAPLASSAMTAGY